MCGAVERHAVRVKVTVASVGEVVPVQSFRTHGLVNADALQTTLG